MLSYRTWCFSRPNTVFLGFSGSRGHRLFSCWLLCRTCGGVSLCRFCRFSYVSWEGPCFSEFFHLRGDLSFRWSWRTLAFGFSAFTVSSRLSWVSLPASALAWLAHTIWGLGQPQPNFLPLLLPHQSLNHLPPPLLHPPLPHRNLTLQDCPNPHDVWKYQAGS